MATPKVGEIWAMKGYERTAGCNRRTWEDFVRVRIVAVATPGWWGWSVKALNGVKYEVPRSALVPVEHAIKRKSEIAEAVDAKEAVQLDRVTRFAVIQDAIMEATNAERDQITRQGCLIRLPMDVVERLIAKLPTGRMHDK